MNLNFAKLFPKADKAPVQLKILRDMRLEVEGEIRHVSQNEEVTVSRETFEQLSQDDYRLISPAKPSGEVISDPSPDRPEPRPLPARWESLPACFREFWECSESVRCAREHIGLIQEKRMAIFGVGTDFADARGTILVGGFHFADDRRNKNVVSTLRPVDFDNPENKRLDFYLTKAETAAEDYLARLLEKVALPQQRRYLECGNFYINSTSELQEILAELESIGFAIFSTRIQALGLADHQNRRLYHGSADFMKYGSHGSTDVQGLASAGYDDAGNLRVYCDLEISTCAGHLLRVLDRTAELKPLLIEGRRELAKTRKAAA